MVYTLATMQARHNSKKGFTIVELVIVIIVIAILSALVAIGYNRIQDRSKIVAIDTALTQTADELTNYKTDNTTFPAALIDVGVTDSSTITYQYTYNAPIKGYCLDATSSSITRFVTDVVHTPLPGTCAAMSGVVGWWRLEGDAKDSSGYKNNGKVVGATPTKGYGSQNESAYSFNGTSNEIAIPDSASLTIATNVSLTAWVYPTSSGTIRGVATKNNWNTSVDNPPFALQINEVNEFAFTTVSAGGSFRYASPVPLIAANTWYFLTGTFDGTTVKSYLNAVASGVAQSQTDLAATTGQPFRIGQGKSGLNRWFMGTIDDVRLYNRALTQTDVTTLYNAGAL